MEMQEILFLHLAPQILTELVDFLKYFLDRQEEMDVVEILKYLQGMLLAQGMVEMFYYSLEMEAQLVVMVVKLRFSQVLEEVLVEMADLS